MASTKAATVCGHDGTARAPRSTGPGEADGKVGAQGARCRRSGFGRCGGALRGRREGRGVRGPRSSATACRSQHPGRKVMRALRSRAVHHRATSDCSGSVSSDSVDSDLPPARGASGLEHLPVVRNPGAAGVLSRGRKTENAVTPPRSCGPGAIERGRGQGGHGSRTGLARVATTHGGAQTTESNTPARCTCRRTCTVPS